MQTFSLSSFLAGKEIWRNRGRFFLFSLVIGLITLLVLFIAALGEGLGNGNREYIANINGDLIVFRENSDYIISASRLDQTTARSIRRIDGVADAGGISASNTAIILPEDVLKVSLIGVEQERPGFPVIAEGKSFSSGLAREAIVDRNVLTRSNIKIGDEITVRSTQGTEDEYYTLTVVGTTDGQSFFFQPSIFVSPQTWERIRPKSAAEFSNVNPTINIVAVKLEDPSTIAATMVKLEDTVSNIETADIPTTINNIPGYSAQQGTVQTQGGIHAAHRHSGDRWFLPDSDPAESASNRCPESDRRLQRSGWMGGSHPDTHRHCDGSIHWWFIDVRLFIVLPP